MKIAIIGVGNDMKGDDGIGPLVAERFFEKVKDAHDTILTKTYAPENIIGKIISFDPDVVVVFDAAIFGGAPGECRLIEREELTTFSMSTHNAPLGIFFEIIKESSKATIYLIGIQVESTHFGNKISEKVMSSVPSALSLANDVLRKHL
ncbi:MAG: hydrogenase 3 maturation endopeptidase HyCI [Candidatus Micrarchaeota archaeon]|nr:hydrogenase 3 maturation endopeptidase HyCI [Candidatus Micrarchaeota archaeon]